MVQEICLLNPSDERFFLKLSSPICSFLLSPGQRAEQNSGAKAPAQHRPWSPRSLPAPSRWPTRHLWEVPTAATSSWKPTLGTRWIQPHLFGDCLNLGTKVDLGLWNMLHIWLHRDHVVISGCNHVRFNSRFCRRIAFKFNLEVPPTSPASTPSDQSPLRITWWQRPGRSFLASGKILRNHQVSSCIIRNCVDINHLKYNLCEDIYITRFKSCTYFCLNSAVLRTWSHL